ncbi:MAG: 16S rRNA (adenine(1518)-N(6)/adenine(1519)-N(6))-dimethyltransferase RsmA [Clostridia bacterium]|nr:16S rRNA (adenine(1518)-N(6)/adenine(1519)-N(6))-dimethyltransferase RsmA [Clostridia bacterium]
MERLSDIGEIKRILSKHGFTFSKAMGQNFLVNPSVCPRMAQLSGADENTGVIEIGPGIGVLTNELCKIARKVVSIELDTRLMPVLAETLAEHENFKVINADVMKVDLHKLIEEEFAGMDVVVCANLPYYITSPIIMKLLEDKLPIKALTVMVQKEAADRLCAEVGSRESGAVTVAVNYYSEAEKLFGVSRGSFMPAPNVDSAVIRLNVAEKPRVDVKDEKLFFRMVKSAFGQRRKTISNSVTSGLSLSKDAFKIACENAGVSPTARAEALTLDELASLANAICDIK